VSWHPDFAVQGNLGRNNPAQIVPCHDFKYKNLSIFKKRKGLQNKFSTTNKTNTFWDKVILLQIASDSKIAIQNRSCEWTLKKTKELSGVVTFFGRDISQ
jgi:hypothetical protein